MLAIQRPHFFGRVLLENILRRDAYPRSRPHIRDIKILSSIVIVVEPADAHTCADVFDSSLRCDIGKSSVAIVAIKILPPEIVYHVKIGPSIAVVITPSTAETVTGVIPVEPRFRRHVAEGSVPVVAHHKVGRPILR